MSPAPTASAHPTAPAADLHHFHNSYWPFWIAIGVGFLYLGIAFPRVGIPLGVLIGGVALASWIRMDVANWRRVHQEEHQREEVGQPGGLWGTVLFIATEVMLFGGIFGLWFVVRHHAVAAEGYWPPIGSPELPILPTAINTAILVASGGTLHWGMLGLRHGNQKRYLVGLALTILLGTTFLVGQIREYLTLVHEGLTLSSGAFGSGFYLLTGTHGAHVAGGLVFLLIVLIRSLLKTQNPKRHLALESSAIYWHFVDVVWIFLFAVVYLQLL